MNLENLGTVILMSLLVTMPCWAVALVAILV